MLLILVHKRFYFTLEATNGSLGVFDLNTFQLNGRHNSNEGLKFFFIKHLKFCELAIGVLKIHHIFGLFFTPSFLQETLKFLVYFEGVIENCLSVSVVNLSLLLSLDRVVILLDAFFLELSNNKLIDSWSLNVRDLTKLSHNYCKFI